MFYSGKNIILSNFTTKSIKISCPWKGYLTSCRPDSGLNRHVPCHRVYNSQHSNDTVLHLLPLPRDTVGCDPAGPTGILLASGGTAAAANAKAECVCRSPKSSPIGYFLIVRYAFKRERMMMMQQK